MNNQVIIVVTPKGEYVSFTEVESAAANHHIHVYVLNHYSLASCWMAL